VGASAATIGAMEQPLLFQPRPNGNQIAEWLRAGGARIIRAGALLTLALLAAVGAAGTARGAPSWEPLLRGWRAALSLAVGVSCSALMLLATAERVNALAPPTVVGTDDGSGGAGNTRLLVTGGVGDDLIVITGSGPLATESYTVSATHFGATTSDPDCSQTDATHVKCTMNSPFIRVDAAQSDDEVTISVSTPSVRFLRASLIGGDGSDTLTGNYGDNDLQGGAGQDMLTGNLGADILDGGAQRDTVSYADRTSASTGVTVGIGGGANDGEPGEGDDVRANVENVTGGAGPDRLTGDLGANLLDGGAGDDEILGGGGSDSDYSAASPCGAGAVLIEAYSAGLIGGSGNDHLVGGQGTDKLVGGEGNDRLEGGGDEDAAVSQAESNVCSTWSGRLDGGPGADLLSAFDGSPDPAAPESDDLRCGADPDSYVADVGDDTIDFDCETNADPDEDGIPVAADNCPAVSNSDQANTDGDALGDACDPTGTGPQTGTGTQGTNGTTANALCQPLRKKLKKAKTKAAKKRIRHKLRSLACYP
jgi:Ca2+-binding RTX toxin-like protein